MLRELIEEYAADRKALKLIYPNRHSMAQDARFRKLNLHWLERLAGFGFPADRAGRADYVLFRCFLERELRLPELNEEMAAPARALVPFAQDVFDLEEQLLRMEFIGAQEAASRLHHLGAATAKAKSAVAAAKPSNQVGIWATGILKEAKESLQRWQQFYRGYDPEFAWWVEAPYRELESSLDDLITETSSNDRDITGTPVGRDRLQEDLAYERITYSPEELIGVAEREFKWCEKQMVKAAQDLGFKNDWRKAQEHVKGSHARPGGQPALVKKLALEAVEFVQDLVTVPDLARETMHMSMMSAKDQQVNPFFLGGKKIVVSYPTAEMSHAEKLMAMRGNNEPFSRATVQHELIPGHHLQWFTEARHRPYRQLFATPFWIEGWTLHWEMLLWDLGFPRTPEERIGMIFWRKHRCVRVIFSLGFHLGKLTPQECLDTLVDRVGHERSNAEGEVRRSFSGDYPPLYQLAYLIGGLQFRALHKELVGSRKLSHKEFHDAILRENNIPPYMMRGILRGDEITQNYAPDWRFADAGGLTAGRPIR